MCQEPFSRHGAYGIQFLYNIKEFLSFCPICQIQKRCRGWIFVNQMGLKLSCDSYLGFQLIQFLTQATGQVGFVGLELPKLGMGRFGNFLYEVHPSRGLVTFPAIPSQCWWKTKTPSLHTASQKHVPNHGTLVIWNGNVKLSRSSKTYRYCLGNLFDINNDILYLIS